MVDPSHSEFTGAHLHSITSLSLKRWPADTLWLTWWQSWLPLTSCSEILTDESCRKISERSTTNLVEVSTGREALSGHAAALSCPAGRRFCKHSSNEGYRKDSGYLRNGCGFGCQVLYALPREKRGQVSYASLHRFALCAARC